MAVVLLTAGGSRTVVSTPKQICRASRPSRHTATVSATEQTANQVGHWVGACVTGAVGQSLLAGFHQEFENIIH